MSSFFLLLSLSFQEEPFQGACFRHVILLPPPLPLPFRKNPSKDADAVMISFFLLLCRFLFIEFGIKVERKDFLDLDSSTQLKFSHHVILAREGKLVFQDNRHAGTVG